MPLLVAAACAISAGVTAIWFGRRGGRTPGSSVLFFAVACMGAAAILAWTPEPAMAASDDCVTDDGSSLIGASTTTAPTSTTETVVDDH